MHLNCIGGPLLGVADRAFEFDLATVYDPVEAVLSNDMPTF